MIGLAFCALAGEVKIPALIGVVLIGWWWSDDAPSWPQRIPRMAIALVTAAGLTALFSALSGLGWRWLGGLSDPGVVVSWLDPATAVGLALSHLVGVLGGGEHQAAFVQGSRAAGLGVAALDLRRTDRALAIGPVISRRWGGASWCSSSWDR